MTTATAYGWALLILVSIMNSFVFHTLMRWRLRVVPMVLLFAVPMFVGFALAQMGVNLLGGGR